MTEDSSQSGAESAGHPRATTARRRFLSALGIGTAILAGCSADDDSTPTGTTSATPTDPRPADTVSETLKSLTATETPKTPTATETPRTPTATETPTETTTATPPSTYTAYVGTFSDGATEGIYRCRVDPENGAMEQVGGPVESGADPSFLAVHPTGEFLYAINSVTPGTVTAFEMQGSGALSRLNRVQNGGEGPTHVSIDATGSYLLVSDIKGGFLSMMPIAEDGSLQEPSHVLNLGRNANIHGAVPGPENEVAYVADIGTDTFFVHEMDLEAGRFEEKQRISIASGARSRHAAVHPAGSMVYLLCESSNELHVFERADDGTLSRVSTLGTLPPDFDGESYTAEVAVHGSGEFMFVSNRGYDSIATFELDAEGVPTLAGQTDTGGSWPRHFAISPDGRLLFAENEKSDDIYAFKIGDDGALEPTGEMLAIPNPVCMRFRL